MSKVQKAKELVFKAQELRGNRAVFLRDIAGPLRKQISQINLDNNLSPSGRIAKVKELKEAETKKFMQQIALRKQAYTQYLTNAKKLAKETIEKSFVSADDATRAKFNREFAELKFKMALKDEKGSFNEIQSFVNKTPDPAYASLLLENFHELAGKFNTGEFKIGLSKTYDRLKADHTPEEVAEAFDVIETVDGSINNKMFTILQPGDNPAANVEYSVIAELFTTDAVRYYQNPEIYFEKNDEPMPMFVDPEEVVEKQKSKVDQAYDSLEAIMEQKFRDGELKLGGNQ
ncbi:hypothetical protein QF028_003511 [Neobacillus sp. B4I6]|uniref:hypothetical protein n=1 Tax=Neobacillus sp. B4I6 TaxID=3373925 RepID=UPI003D21B4A3